MILMQIQRDIRENRSMEYEREHDVRVSTRKVTLAPRNARRYDGLGASNRNNEYVYVYGAGARDTLRTDFKLEPSRGVRIQCQWHSHGAQTSDDDTNVNVNTNMAIGRGRPASAECES